MKPAGSRDLTQNPHHTPKHKRQRKAKQAPPINVPWALKKIIDPFALGAETRDKLSEIFQKQTERKKYYYNEDGFPMFADSTDVDGETANEDEMPEVLVVSPSTSLGLEVVKVLKRRKFPTRVLVPDLYSSTLRKFAGSHVSFCKGDLGRPDVTEIDLAVTEIDKIVFCGGVPEKGVKILVQRLMDTRFSDYGLSQSPKRLLFQFKKSKNGKYSKNRNDFLNFAITSSAEDGFAEWKENSHNRGVFVGSVNGEGDVVSLMSGRLRGGENNDGIDLSDFSGVLLRGCGDGSQFEVVLRAGIVGQREEEGIFTATFTTKKTVNKDYEVPKFSTVVLPFASFKLSEDGERGMLDATDIRQIGISYRFDDSPSKTWTKTSYERRSFYLALHYIKVVRLQPEADIVFVSNEGDELDDTETIRYIQNR